MLPFLDPETRVPPGHPEALGQCMAAPWWT
jgi:hypothetical protein